MGAAVHAPAVSAGQTARILHHLPVLLRGRPLRGRERYRPFFIVGSGRCGTTLLRAMLEAHPDVHIPPEMQALGHVIRDYRRYSRLPWNVVLRIVLTQFEYHPRREVFELALEPVFHELDRRPPDARNLAGVLNAIYRAHMGRHKPSSTRWGDKTPLNALILPQLRSVFPDLRVIHMLRDGRDVVESYIRLADQGLLFFAEKWIRTVSAARRFAARHPGQYLEVRYEELAREPQGTIQTVATFLDLSPDDRMLRYHELDLWLRDLARVPHMQGALQPVYQGAVGRWRTGLDAGQRAELGRLLGPMLTALGYDGE